MMWFISPDAHPDQLGFLPGFINEDDPRPAAKQLDANYRHGGGWRPQPQFTIRSDGALLYPGDPPMPLRAWSRLRDEVIGVYDYGYVSVTQPDGSFEVCRMD